MYGTHKPYTILITQYNVYDGTLGVIVTIMPIIFVF